MIDRLNNCGAVSGNKPHRLLRHTRPPRGVLLRRKKVVLSDPATKRRAISNSCLLLIQLRAPHFQCLLARLRPTHSSATSSIAFDKVVHDASLDVRGGATAASKTLDVHAIAVLLGFPHPLECL